MQLLVADGVESLPGASCGESGAYKCVEVTWVDNERHLVHHIPGLLQNCYLLTTWYLLLV